MTTSPIFVDRDTDNPHIDHIQLSTLGIGIKSRNDKILITSRNGDIWITAIDYDGKSSAVNIDRDTLIELIDKTKTELLGLSN